MGYSRALLSPRDYYIPIFLLHHSFAVLSIPYSNLLLVHHKSLPGPKVWYLLYWMYGDPFWLRRFELRLLIFQCRALTLGLQAVLEWWIFALLFLMEPSYSVYSFVQGLEAVSVLLPLDTLTHTRVWTTSAHSQSVFLNDNLSDSRRSGTCLREKPGMGLQGCFTEWCTGYSLKTVSKSDHKQLKHSLYYRLFFFKLLFF